MRIAIINSVFDYGSTGSLARQLYEYGKEAGYEVYALYGRGQKYDDERIIRIEPILEVYFHKIMTLLLGNQGYYSYIATRRLIRFLNQKEIEHVVLLNLHGYYLNEPLLWRYLKTNSVKAVYLTPDEYAGLGKCAYCGECTKYMTECDQCPKVRVYPKSLIIDQSNRIFKMKERAYKGYDNIIIMGPETNLMVFRQSALLKTKTMKCLDWGIDLDIYQYRDPKETYKRYSIPQNKVIVLTVAKYSNGRKGVKTHFFELAKRMEGMDYHFINVGYDGHLEKDDIPPNITLIPYIDDQVELTRLYSLADVYLLPSVSDTMPLTCLISFACETPVICFRTSGLINLDPHNIGVVEYVEDISVQGLYSVLLRYGKKSLSIRKKARDYAEERFSKTSFNKNVYDELIGDNNE